MMCWVHRLCWPPGFISDAWIQGASGEMHGWVYPLLAVASSPAQFQGCLTWRQRLLWLHLAVVVAMMLGSLCIRFCGLQFLRWVPAYIGLHELTDVPSFRNCIWGKIGSRHCNMNFHI